MGKVMLDTLVSVREYLSTVYHPDVDYVDGQLEERNVGEKEHSKLQGRIYILLMKMRTPVPFIETRVRISATHYRIPDICAYEREPDEAVFSLPPVLCVEIVSPDDRISRITRVAEDYLGMGVPNVWVLDPLEKKAYVVDPALGFHEVKDCIATHDKRVVLTLAEIFSQDDVL